MIRRHQMPDGHRFIADLSDFALLARREGHAVLLETAGILCGRLSALAVDVSVAAGAKGRELRTAADVLAPVRPASVQHLHLAPPVSYAEADEAARLESMRRHPAGKGLAAEEDVCSG